jgi:hypothetical protein
MMFFVLKDEPRRQDAIEAIRMLNITKPQSVEIKEYRKNRSNSQNRLYWSWVNLIAEHTGDLPEEIHEMMKQRLLGTVPRRIMGEDCLVTKSTTKLTTCEFTEYLQRIELLADKLQIRLPHPDDYLLAMHGG